MARPTLEVSVAFASDPLDDTPTWTDITAYVMSLRTVTGRQRSIDRFDVGTLQLELDNSGRRFDPMYAAGPYYGNLLPNKQVRVRATWNSTTYDVFYGFVNGWPQDYNPPGDAVSVVTVTDAFRWWANQQLAGSVYEFEVMQDDPTLFVRFNQVEGETWLDSSGNGNHCALYQPGNALTSEASRGPAPLSVGGESPIDMQNSRISTIQATIPELDVFPSNTWSIDFWFQGPTYAGNTLNKVFEVAYGNGFDIAIRNGKLWYIEEWSGGAPSIYKATVSDVADGDVHHLAITKTGTTVLMYIDGVSATLTSSGSLSGTWAPTGYGSFLLYPGSSDDPSPEYSRVSDVAVYPTVLSLARVKTHYRAGRTPWTGPFVGVGEAYSTADQRLDQLADSVGWPSTWRSFDAGQTAGSLVGFDLSYLANARWNSVTALEYAHKVADSEAGYLYVDHRNGGYLTFKGKYSRSNSTNGNTVQYTFSDATNSGTVYRYDRLELEYDQDEIINDVEVKYLDNKVRYYDTSSIDAYGSRSKTVDTEVRWTPARLAPGLAEWWVARYKNPGLRARSVSIDAGSDNATNATYSAFTAALGAKIGDRLNVRRAPQGIGDAISQDVIVEGIEHSVGPGGTDWRTVLRCSSQEAAPIAGFDISVFDTGEFG